MKPKRYYRGWVRLGVVLAAVVSALAVAACGSSTTQSTASSSTAAKSSTSTPASTATKSSSTSVAVSSCGPKPGVTATGTPINIGAIATKQPGTDFSDGPNMLAAYFACVNANGGVNGHPLKLYTYFDQSQPAQITADAKALISSDHVVAIDGVFDILECTVDQKYWQSLGIYEIDAGIAAECWSTSHSAPVNLGPRYSSDGAVQYALDQHPSKLVFAQEKQPGIGYVLDGPKALANAARVPIAEVMEDVPIQSPDTVALQLANAAGPNGAVVLDFTPPEALVILQAAEKLGLENKVKAWGCSTPCDTDYLAKALGPKWNHKLFVNSELNPPDAPDPNSRQMQLYKEVFAKYGSSVSGGVGSFSEMGFVGGEILQHALESVKGPYTLKSVNQAIVNVKDFNTGMECRPWSYGKLPLHIPNNVDYTVTPQNGKMVIAKGCAPISSNDPQIAAYRSAAKQAGLTP